ncbi:protease complex subunit PrcB family protein [Flavobacterium urocaniciphilum]|uniref:PrcB C-terminal n=1 Tax=Flavobacterium urocaniciphilum TaxID=1299341 RepID=A0A1H8ZFC8_9FLAO|nr:protease complex subunit PrcB family protein [Flavobacterium urocaniciphilum]SEP63114.1 PrcB C-terminal [Flavobacterium urocaniciphilum]
MNKLFKLSALIICFSGLFQFCKTQKHTDVNDVYTVMYKNQNGGKKEKSTIIITNYEEFNSLIATLTIDEEEYGKLLSIDLEKHNLIAAFMGEKNTGGYDIDIDKVTFFPTKVEVGFKEIVPEKGAMVTMAFTSPYIFVAVPKNKEIILK